MSIYGRRIVGVRSTETYLSGVGHDHRTAHAGPRGREPALELRAGIVAGTGRRGEVLVAHMTPQEIDTLRERNMSPSRSSLDRLPKHLHAVGAGAERSRSLARTQEVPAERWRSRWTG